MRLYPNPQEVEEGKGESLPNPPLHPFPVPFQDGWDSSEETCCTNSDHDLPITFLDEALNKQILTKETVNSPNLERYLFLNFDLHKLDGLQPYLCLVITESVEEHLVWSGNTIFLKPLPRFLTCYCFWKSYICENSTEQGNGGNVSEKTKTYQSAYGFLLTYVRLIPNKSDFLVAEKHGLLPEGMSWRSWSAFATSILQEANIMAGNEQTCLAPRAMINTRFHYGELRLSRLTILYRVRNCLSLHAYLKGYMPRPTWQGAFLERRFKWLLAVYAYLSAVLAALQVGLSTTYADLESYQALSYAVSTSALAILATSLFAMLCQKNIGYRQLK
ncbi:hypothetical protein PG996_011190 [Apiospora saccharicola]|uniref:Uncharacterized protein n=1 Tax=Apiospora saccharicola TaxID=335842 RepID=A0ABR1UEC1_9PEZI